MDFAITPSNPLLMDIVWQRNYCENIIRNEKSYHRISNYIINNPGKWDVDKFFMKKKVRLV